MRNLVGKRILITGAGSGLGKALALHFAGKGWRIAVTDRSAVSAQQTLQQVKALGADCIADLLDVTSEGSFRQVVARLEKEWGGVDVLVNNAGVASAGTVEDSTIEQWQWIININLLGCVRGARAVLPLMKRQGGGHIVNIASFAGIANPPAMASYNATKAAVISLSETLRFESYPDGVGVSVACPSFFKTALIQTSQSQAPADGVGPAPQVMKITGKLMDSATVTAEDVARDIYEAVQYDRFMVITHPDARQRFRVKRFAPELYFKMAQKMTAKFLNKPAT